MIAPAGYAQMAAPLKPAGDFEGRYDYFAMARAGWRSRANRGRILIKLASDTHLLMSRKNDVIRLWNAGTTNARYTKSPNGKGLVQIVNYATRLLDIRELVCRPSLQIGASWCCVPGQPHRKLAG